MPYRPTGEIPPRPLEARRPGGSCADPWRETAGCFVYPGKNQEGTRILGPPDAAYPIIRVGRGSGNINTPVTAGQPRTRQNVPPGFEDGDSPRPHSLSPPSPPMTS